jgi:hypothetical protein
MLDLHSRYPTVEFVLDAVADWIKNQRSTHGIHDDLGQCGPQEFVKIAKELGVPASDLRGLAAQTPEAANALPKMLCALSINPAALTDGQPATMRDLQRTCIFCKQKSRCRRELAEGTAAGRYREFCPNAYTLDALLGQTEPLHTH